MTSTLKVPGDVIFLRLGRELVKTKITFATPLPLYRMLLHFYIGRDGRGMWVRSAPLVSISALQKLSHLFLLHRAYKSPIQLHKWGSRDTPLCLKCERDHGDLLHMIWRCPQLFRYWAEVTNTISQVYIFRLNSDPIVCLLGALEIDMLTPNVHVAVLHLLYVARKLIARYLISPNVPLESIGTGKHYAYS